MKKQQNSDTLQLENVNVSLTVDQIEWLKICVRHYLDQHSHLTDSPYLALEALNRLLIEKQTEHLQAIKSARLADEV